ncbi:MAG: hypothetical protein V3R99_06460, partial [Thermoguttaceae bacterium]
MSPVFRKGSSGYAVASPSPSTHSKPTPDSTPVRHVGGSDRVDSAESEELKLDLLAKAAACLEAAGMPEEAQRVREEIKKKKLALATRLEAMEKEVQHLKRILGKDQQVMIQMRMLEIDVSKLQELGFDFSKSKPDATSGGNLILAKSPADLSQDTSYFRIVDQDAQFLKMLNALQQDNLARVVAEPTLVTLSGRQAFMHVVGEFPVALPKPGDVSTVDFQQVGTRIDVLPTVLDNGRVRLEIRCRTSTLATTAEEDVEPALEVHTIDTSLEMMAGQTCILGGLIQRRPSTKDATSEDVDEESQSKDSGNPTEGATKDIAMVVLVTPKLVEPMRAA